MSKARSYPDVLVKVGVERGYLLSSGKLKALTECRSLAEFALALQETIYADKLNEVTLPYSSRKFERSFKESFIEVSCKIAQHCPEDVSQFLEIFLLRFEHENIKTVLRAIRVGLSYEEILSRIHMAAEDYLKRRAFLENASKAIDIRSIVDIFKDTIYGQLLSSGFQKYEETESIKFFDILLDKMFYEHLGSVFEALPKREQRHAFFYITSESDGFNLLTILRAKILNYDSDLIRTAISSNFYRISKRTIEDLLLSNDFETAFNIIKQSYYSRFFTRDETPEETVSAASMAFRRAMFENAKKMRVGYPFNIGALLGLIVEKDVEVNNLTAISLGIEYSLKSNDIWSLLLV